LLPWLWVALILLHILAALRHQFVMKDGVLRRMTG
jgi:cytochrome b561